MASNFKVTGHGDFDTIFKSRVSSKRADVNYVDKALNVDISSLYEASAGNGVNSNADQISFNTNYLSNGKDLRYFFQSYNNVVATAYITLDTSPGSIGTLKLDGNVVAAGVPTQVTLGTTHTIEVTNLGTYTFNTQSGWSDDSGNLVNNKLNPATTYTINSIVAFTAHLLAPNTYNVTLADSPAGASSTLMGAGTYHYNDQVHIQTTAATNYTFSHWKDTQTQATIYAQDGITPLPADALFYMPQNSINYTAVFTYVPPPPPPTVYYVTLNVDPVGGGTINYSSGYGPTHDSGTGYYSGEHVYIDATNAYGYNFSYWDVTGGATSIDTSAPNQVNFYINGAGNVTVTGYFTPTTTPAPTTTTSTTTPAPTTTTTTTTTTPPPPTTTTTTTTTTPPPTIYYVTLNVNPNGEGTIDYAGGYAPTHSGGYYYNEPVIIQVTNTYDGYTFDNSGWNVSGSSELDTSVPGQISFYITGNTTVTANLTAPTTTTTTAAPATTTTTTPPPTSTCLTVSVDATYNSDNADYEVEFYYNVCGAGTSYYFDSFFEPFTFNGCVSDNTISVLQGGNVTFGDPGSC